MEGYGNFPALVAPKPGEGGTCRAVGQAKADPPFQPLAFSLQHLPSPRRSNPVKPSQTMFLGWTATKDRSAPSKNRSFSRRLFPAPLFRLWPSALDPRPSTLVAAPPRCVPLRQISTKPMAQQSRGDATQSRRKRLRINSLAVSMNSRCRFRKRMGFWRPPRNELRKGKLRDLEKAGGKDHDHFCPNVLSWRGEWPKAWRRLARYRIGLRETEGLSRRPPPRPGLPAG